MILKRNNVFKPVEILSGIEITPHYKWYTTFFEFQMIHISNKLTELLPYANSILRHQFSQLP
jgi:hypothetical protein